MTNTDDAIGILTTIALILLGVFVAAELAGAAIAVLVSCAIQSEAG